MKKNIIISFLILFCVNLSFSQNEIETPNQLETKLNDIKFYTDYTWESKKTDNTNQSKTRVTKSKILNGVALYNTVFTANRGEKLRPFLAGVAGWDPVERKIKFLDFSSNGMMVEGSISLIDSLTIQYDFEFAFPGSNAKQVIKDILNFNSSRSEFIWKSYRKNSKGVYKNISTETMVKIKKAS